MSKLTALSLLLLLAGVCHFPRATDSANVLAVLPSVWKSHYLFGRRLLEQLVASAEHNHSVTLISPYASDAQAGDTTTRAAAIREIQIPGLHENWLEMGLSCDVEQMRQISVMERFTRLIYAGATNVDLLLGDAQTRKLLRSGEHFDLLVVDLLFSDSLLGLAHYYQIPTVVVSPSGANTWLNQMLGNPQNSALDPSNFLDYAERMSMWERCVNTLMAVFEKLTYNFFHMISQQSVYVKHFQPLLANATTTSASSTLPHHRELAQNLSLVLINSHPVVQYPRAYLPNMLQIAGAHLHQPEEQQLPQHLREFIESAPAGAVYVSLGANARIVDLAREKLDALLDVFAYLKDMRFVLKWELPEFDADLPANVLTNEWLPQEAILAHPNVKVFISACGLMSIVESINGLTPLLAIPIYPEQEVAARRLHAQGVALTLSFDDIAYDGLLHSLQQLSTNASYSENILQLRGALNSDYGTPAAKTLHYIEMILRSGGAMFLKSHAHHLNFLRTELVDVLAIIVVGLLAIVAVPFVVTCCILKRSYYNQAQQQQATVAAGAGYRATLKVVGRTNSAGAAAAGGGGAGGEPAVRRRRTSTSVSTSSTSSSSGGGECAAAVRHSAQSSQQSD